MNRIIPMEDQSGPAIVVGQLQFCFENVPELTLAERLDAWLRDQDRESSDALVARLFLTDSESRRRRADRWLQLQFLEEQFESSWGWLVPGGIEAMWLYHEAHNSYINGMYVAALLCSHAACERVLAGCLQGYDDMPKGWDMWGLGKLIPAAFERGLIDSSLRTSLEQTSELRKVTAHFKPPLTPESVLNRVYRHSPESADAFEDEIDGVLKADALITLRTATELLFGDQGFKRARWW